MANSLLLSIDFDWFVPEPPELDFGHQEASCFFKEALWGIRAAQYAATGYDLVQTMSPTGADLTPLKVIPFLREAGWQIAKQCKFTISDSHKYAYPAFHGHLGATVVNFDAHHDMGYSKAVDMRSRWNRGSIQCEDWAWFLLKGRDVGRVVQVYPTWKGLEEIDGRNHWDATRIAERFEAHVFSNDVISSISGEVQAIHLARSSSWVPPWNDHVVAQTIAAIEQDIGTEAVLLHNGLDNPEMARFYDPRLQREFHPEAVDSMTKQLRDCSELWFT